MSDHDHNKENSVTEIDLNFDPEDSYTIPVTPDPDEHTPEETAPEPNCVTAFIVVVGMDGSAMASAEIEKANTLVPLRPATVVDMRRGCDEVVHDVNAMQISQQTVAIIQQQAQAMAEQTQQQRMAEALMKKGITVPGRGR